MEYIYYKIENRIHIIHRIHRIHKNRIHRIN